MTPEQFKTWRKRHFRSQQAAADALGLSRDTVVNYEAGRRRDSDQPVEIPRTVELACAAIEEGITGYVEPSAG